MADYVPKRFRNLPLPHLMAEAQRKAPKTWRWVKFSGEYQPDLFSSWNTSTVFEKYIKHLLGTAGYVPKSDIIFSKSYKNTHRDGSITYTKNRIDLAFESVMRGMTSHGYIQKPEDIVQQHSIYEYTIAFNSSIQLDELDFLITMAPPCKIPESMIYVFGSAPRPKKYNEVHFWVEAVGVPTTSKPAKPKPSYKLPEPMYFDSTFVNSKQSVGRMARNTGKTKVQFLPGYGSTITILKGRGNP